ncbi:MAG: hypothetical protein DCF20_00635 [Pseudanabaena sp.]|nr:MAG: hypothetical protein DCF20_00635 [Pseudanabaena sp.]
MLPTEPKSKLTVSQASKTMLNSANVVVAKNFLLQFATKSGRLIMQHPFWVLVVGSVGIHTAFAFVTPNPLKKAEPPEVIVSTLPVVKLPPKQLSTSSKSNVFSDLFVKSAPKTGLPLNTFPDISSSSPLTTLDLDSLSSFDGLPPVTEPFSVPPFPNTPDTPKFVKPQTPASTPPKNPDLPSFTQSGKIDNTTPVKPSNIKPEFQNGGPKNPIASPPPTTKNTDNSKDPSKVSTNIQGTESSNSATDARKEKEIGNVAVLYTSDKQIIDLLSKNLIRNTQIAPDNALISDPDLNREKGVAWIPPKVTNVPGKKGTVTFMWLVDPKGEVQTRYLKSSGSKELDDIARDAVKDYKFKPIEDTASGKYRLVTAKYDFP